MVTQGTEYKIKFDKNAVLGKGIHGTVVFRGNFGKRDVAVKRVVSMFFDELAVQEEIELLERKDWHKNVMRFYDMEKQGDFHCIALELCDCTLNEFVDGSKLQHANGKALLFGAMKGVDYLHQFNIVHRDLKPQNILLKLTPLNEVIPKISDFGLFREIPDNKSHKTTINSMAGTLGWIAPEMSQDTPEVRPAVDIFAMGCIIYYVLSHGKHPFGHPFGCYDRIICQVKICENKDDKLFLSDLEGEDKFTVEDLVRAMIKSKHELRPSSGEVLAHCLFWSKDKQLEFFQEVNDWIQQALKNKPPGSIVDDLEKEALAVSVFVDDWKNNIDKEVKEDLEKTDKKTVKYVGTLVRDLLRAIRNKNIHFEELPETFKAKVCSRKGLASYFGSQFPRLLICTHKVMEKEPNFKEHHPNFFKKDLLHKQDDIVSIKSTDEKSTLQDSIKVQEKDSYIAELQKKDKMITTLQKQLEQFNQQISTTSDHHDLQQLHHQVHEKDSHIAQLNRRLFTVSKEKEDALQQLKVTSHQLLSLRSSQKTTDVVSYLPKLAVVLQPVQEYWEQLGLQLNIDQSVLTNIRSKGDSTEQMKYLLEEWSLKGGTLTQLEDALLHLDMKHVIPGLLDLQDKTQDFSDKFPQVSTDFSDKSIQVSTDFSDKSPQVSTDFSDKSIQVSTDFSDKSPQVSTDFSYKSIQVSTDFSDKSIQVSTDFSDKSIQVFTDFSDKSIQVFTDFSDKSIQCDYWNYTNISGCRHLVMIIILGFGVIFLAWLVWFLIHVYGENTRWYYLEEYLLEIVWIALGVIVAAVIFSCVIHAFGDNGWWKSFAIVLVICVLVAIDWQIPSNDKTKLVIESALVTLLSAILLLCGCKSNK